MQKKCPFNGKACMGVFCELWRSMIVNEQNIDGCVFNLIFAILNK